MAMLACRGNGKSKKENYKTLVDQMTKWTTCPRSLTLDMHMIRDEVDEVEGYDGVVKQHLPPHAFRMATFRVHPTHRQQLPFQSMLQSFH